MDTANTPLPDPQRANVLLNKTSALKQTSVTEENLEDSVDPLSMIQPRVLQGVSVSKSSIQRWIYMTDTLLVKDGSGRTGKKCHAALIFSKRQHEIL